MIRDAKSKKVISPRAQPGYYAGFSTLNQKDYWDESTKQIIEKRLEPPSGLKFFSSQDAQILHTILERVMPQDDRDESHKIPILQMIDERLFEKRFEGYVFAGTVEDDVAHRLGLQAIEAMAQNEWHKSFTKLQVLEQETLLLSIKDGNPGPHWTCNEKLPPQHYWSVLIQDAVSAYYAHPFAWDEIGFGGPAYPRGYTRLLNGLPESWETDEKRYDWLAPDGTLSDAYKVNEELFARSKQDRSSGSH